ncbi:IclR family transcriptional regulator [Nocardia xishanensis]
MTEQHLLRHSKTAFGGQQPRAVQKALAMLEAVAHLGAGASANQICAFTQVPSATAYRILNLLVEDGYLVRSPDLSGFALGRRTFEIAFAAAPESARTVADVMSGLRTETRYALYVVSFRDRSIRVVDSDPDHEVVPVTTILRNPHAHAVGKLLLAYHPAALPGIKLRSVTAHTVVKRRTLDEHLVSILATEISVEKDESRIGRAAMAIPIRECGDEVVGGLCLQGPVGRISASNTDLVEFLRRGASDLGGLI